MSAIMSTCTLRPSIGGKHCPVVKTNSTHAGGQGSIPGAGRKRNGSWPLLPDRMDISIGFVNGDANTIHQGM